MKIACVPHFRSGRRHRRVPLESPNYSPDLGSPFEADVVQVHEFAAGHPTQIAKAAVAGAEQGSQHQGFGRRDCPGLRAALHSSQKRTMVPTLILFCVPPAAAQTVPADWHQPVREAAAGGIAKLA